MVAPEQVVSGAGANLPASVAGDGPAPRAREWLSVEPAIAPRGHNRAPAQVGGMMELTKPSLLVRRRLEHALQRRLGDLGEGRADLGLLRRRYPRCLDRRHPGLTD